MYTVVLELTDEQLSRLNVALIMAHNAALIDDADYQVWSDALDEAGY